MGHIQATGFYMIHPGSGLVKYGLLYNWFAVVDARNIAASGAHVVTDAEWAAILLALDPDGYGFANTAGGNMKEAGTTYWSSPNTGADNSSKFNGRGASYRDGDTGVFSIEFNSERFWSSDEYDANSAKIASLNYNSATLQASVLVTYTQHKEFGLSSRVIMDSTDLEDGEEGTYTGNDGKTYRTICIGGMEIIADNLAETKFRNGDSITEVTDNAAWSALTTEGMCAFNNNWDNVMI